MTEIRWRTIAGGSKILQRQCVSCGDPVGSAISQKDKTPEERKTYALWDEDLVQHERAKNEERRRSIIASLDDDRAQRSAEWWAWYNEYLKSPAWQAKRRMVLARDHFICQGCRDAVAVEVHHLTYAHVGDELLFELTSLCLKCHDRAHSPSQFGAPITIV